MSDSSNTIAFIAAGGKQLKAQVGATLLIDRNQQSAEDTITFDKVLLVMDGNTTHVGRPYVDGARVVGKVLGEVKDEKIIVFKKKRRKGYKVTQGHRQPYMQVSVTDIITK